MVWVSTAATSFRSHTSVNHAGLSMWHPKTPFIHSFIVRYLSHRGQFRVIADADTK